MENSENRLAEYVGIDINYHTVVSVNIEIPGVGIRNKESAVRIQNMEYALVASMSCGETVKYKRFKDIPDHDVMCPCGDPTHKILEYVND